MVNEIKTRILLKYDSQANWEASSFILKQGEAAVCEMTPVVEAGQSVILVKYGNGKDKFIDLPWASAPAADVHGWAKQSPEDFIEWVNQNIEHPAAPVITTGTENGTIAVDGADVAVKGLGSAAYTSADAYAPADIDTGVHAVDLATGETNGTVKLTVDGTDKEVAVAGLQDAAYATVASLNATAKGYADAVLAEAKTYADNNDANTEYHVEYDPDNKKIKLVAGADASKMEIDATDFIKDGMIDTVTIGADNDLIITFNTAAGKDDIVLPLDQLVDIYTGVDGAKVKVSVSADKKISADIVAGSIAKADLAADVQTSLGLATEALPKATAETDYLKKTDAANTYREKADKITPTDLSDADEDVFIFNCGSATKNID